MIFLQIPTDSIATGVGGAVGATVASLLTLVLGVVSRYATEAGKYLLGKFMNLGAFGKSIVALVFAQAITFLSAHFGISLSADPTAITTTLNGLVVWAASMGANALIDVLKGLFTTTTTPTA